MTTTGITSNTGQREVRAATGEFVLTKNNKGRYHFTLRVTNGRVIASSEAYNSALNGIASIRKNATGAAGDDQS